MAIQSSTSLLPSGLMAPSILATSSLISCLFFFQSSLRSACPNKKSKDWAGSREGPATAAGRGGGGSSRTFLEEEEDGTTTEEVILFLTGLLAGKEEKSVSPLLLPPPLPRSLTYDWLIGVPVLIERLPVYTLRGCLVAFPALITWSFKTVKVPVDTSCTLWKVLLLRVGLERSGWGHLV